MNDDKLAAEMKALQALVDLMNQAKEVRRLFDEAGSPAPGPLARLLGDTGSDNGRASMTQKALPAPVSRPRVAKDDWVWVPEHELSTAKLALAVLREQRLPITPDVLFNLLKERRNDANKGSVYNLGPRLDGDLLSRGREGWKVIDVSRVPLLHEGYAWGPASVFAKNELAGHRRVVLQHVLSNHTNGLTLTQLAKRMKDSGLCAAPVNKDLVKADLVSLSAEGKIKRLAGAKKWSLA